MALDQRRTFRAGAMNGEHTAELEELGIVWDTADAVFAENLAAARAYYELHGTLAAPRHASALDRAVGQWLTNVRRPGGLGKDPVRARRRAEALAAIDEDWNPAEGEHGWTVDWQRHYAYLAQLLAEGARLTAIIPGVTRHGKDVGRWLATQRRDWNRLGNEQRERLGALGVKAAYGPARPPRRRLRPPRPDGAQWPSRQALKPLRSTWSGRVAACRGAVTSSSSPTAVSTGRGCGSSTRSSAATGSPPSSSPCSPSWASTGPDRDVRRDQAPRDTGPWAR
ncbi:helicase associated domain-containing protein [Streptomyces sp. NPDC099050]|uniref:helicase associated domain-containing protein n=1 Tax=Streptomyces sp. NPDC099050 TaxID=3366100 RepID=UPI0038094C69